MNSGAVQTYPGVAPKTNPQQVIKAGEMVHVGMRDEDVADPQKLAGRQARHVADVKQDRPPIELQVDEHPGVAEGPVDQRRVENGPHPSKNTIRGRVTSRSESR